MKFFLSKIRRRRDDMRGLSMHVHIGQAVHPADVIGEMRREESLIAPRVPRSTTPAYKAA
jgi:hypothetical protein